MAAGGWAELPLDLLRIVFADLETDASARVAMTVTCRQWSRVAEHKARKFACSHYTRPMLGGGSLLCDDRVVDVETGRTVATVSPGDHHAALSPDGALLVEMTHADIEWRDLQNDGRVVARVAKRRLHLFVGSWWGPDVDAMRHISLVRATDAVGTCVIGIVVGKKTFHYVGIDANEGRVFNIACRRLVAVSRDGKTAITCDAPSSRHTLKSACLVSATSIAHVEPGGSFAAARELENGGFELLFAPAGIVYVPPPVHADTGMGLARLFDDAPELESGVNAGIPERSSQSWRCDGWSDALNATSSRDGRSTAWWRNNAASSSCDVVVMRDERRAARHTVAFPSADFCVRDASFDGADALHVLVKAHTQHACFVLSFYPRPNEARSTARRAAPPGTSSTR